MTPPTTIAAAFSHTQSATVQKNLKDKLGRPLHDLRISVIDRCNFRCTYCMPAEHYHESYTFLDKKEWLTFDEIERLARLFVKLGVSKIRITGGEPLLRENLPTLFKKLASVGSVSDLALTTNGIHLPKLAEPLKNAGLQRITVSLDTLDEKIFKKMNGGKGSVKQVLEGIHAAEKAGFSQMKINAVIQQGVNDQSPIGLVRHFRGTGHIVRFIEYMDVGNRNHWQPGLVVPSREIVAAITREFPMKPLGPNYAGEVAERYGFEDGKGEVGFISSITQPFCGTCSRARISTDGKFYLCLFSSVGFDLREPLRSGASDEEMVKLIQNIWQNRGDRYSEERSSLLSLHAKAKKIEMYQIGG